jgi:ribosomal protein L20A (L18A)
MSESDNNSSSPKRKHSDDENECKSGKKQKKIGDYIFNDFAAKILCAFRSVPIEAIDEFFSPGEIAVSEEIRHVMHHSPFCPPTKLVKAYNISGTPVYSYIHPKGEYITLKDLYKHALKTVPEGNSHESVEEIRYEGVDPDEKIPIVSFGTS